MTEDVVSNIAPPVITCPSCEGMLPSELGLVTCVLCSVQVRVEHEPTRRAWVKEKVACPSCNSVLVAGADNRPARLRCGSCGDSFTLLRVIITVHMARFSAAFLSVAVSNLLGVYALYVQTANRTPTRHI